MNMPAKLQGSFLNSLPIFPNILEGYKVHKKYLKIGLLIEMKCHFWGPDFDFLGKYNIITATRIYCHHGEGLTKFSPFCITSLAPLGPDGVTIKHYEQRKIT